ncbi:GntR family transcriptional regulator [Kitasatospora sp. NPDC001527]|uniref:GntR family transcriptional regulator n=1 Tax=Kitasatospora sp. NPDC001527 TaxID=3154519 RepID=UPI00332DF85E
MAQYEEIAAVLRARIEDGTYPPGTALPIMREIAAEWGVSDITVRKSVGLLAAEGLVEGRGRSGVYVLTHPDRVRLTVRSRQVERDELGYYSGQEVQHWRALPWPDGERTRLAEAAVPADVAELLGVEAGIELTVRRRLIGDPDRQEHRQLADSWIAPWILEELPVLSGSTGAGGMYDRIEEWAGRPLAWREEVSARMPAPDEADALAMPREGVPLLRVVRVTVLPGRGRQPERAVEVQDIRMSATQFAVGYPVPRGSTAKWPVRPATSDYYTALGTPT